MPIDIANEADRPAEQIKFLRSFLASTSCPYAGSVRAWIGPLLEDWPNNDALVSLRADFTLFCTQCQAQEIDEYVIDLAWPVRTLGELGGVLKQLLASLSDDLTHPFMFLRGIESLDWDYVACESKFFVQAFSPLYSQNHSRYSPARSYILLQPDSSFDRRGITSRSPNRFAISKQVHDCFVREGKDYDLSLIVGTPKAIRYVKPLTSGDPILKWWL